MQGPGCHNNPTTAKTGYSILNGDAPFSPNDDGRRGKIPVEHMDYAYITNCADAKYLERILTRLSSGADGAFPDLVRHCEDHLRRLDPRNQSLREDNPVARLSGAPEDEWSDLVPPPQYWEEKERRREAMLREQSACPESVPPIRSSFSIPLGQNPQVAKPSKKAAPRDYQEWDKFDVKKECERVDADVTMEEPSSVTSSGHPEIESTSDAKSRTANDERIKGNNAYNAGYYEKAVTYYARSIGVTPTAAAYNNRAMANIKLKDWHRAMEDCQKALELEPGNVKALFRRAQVHNNLRDFAMAAEDLRSLLREHPKDRDAIRLLAEVEKKIGVGQSEAEYRNKGKNILIEEEEEDGGDEDTFASLKQEGENLVNNGQYKDAMVTYSRCLEMKPNDPVVHANRAQCYLKLERFAEAKRDCDAALRLDRRPTTYLRRATAHKGLRDYPACVSDLQLVLRCQPNNWEAEKQLEEALVLHLRNMSAASPDKRRRIVPLADVEGDEEMEETQPGDSEASRRGAAGSADGRPADGSVRPPSRQDAEKERESFDSDDVTMEEDPTIVDDDGRVSSWLDEQALASAIREKERGNEAYRDGLYARALADYSRSIEIAPTAVAFNNRAQALVKLGRWGDALSDCQTVLEEEPRNLKALLRRAEVRRNLGNLPGALDDLTLVLGEVPHNPAANRLLARVESERWSKDAGADIPSYIS